MRSLNSYLSSLPLTLALLNLFACVSESLISRSSRGEKSCLLPLMVKKEECCYRELHLYMLPTHNYSGNTWGVIIIRHVLGYWGVVGSQTGMEFISKQSKFCSKVLGALPVRTLLWKTMQTEDFVVSPIVEEDFTARDSIENSHRVERT